MKRNFSLRKCALKVFQAAAGMAVLLSPATVLANPPGTGWTQTFSDDFNGTTINSKKWDTCYWWSLSGCTNGGSGDVQWYQPDDVIVQNGIARLRAQKRSINGFNYTSGMISSHDKYSFQYGYAEMRAKLPKGRGFWPTFWLLPQSGGWPPEIDIMEYLGVDPNRVHMTLHYSTPTSSHEASFTDWAGPDFSAGYHTFGLEWSPQRLVWYVDGVERKRYEIPANIPAQPMYLVASLAMGAAWTNTPPDATTPFPSYFDIDYIKVWRRQ